MRTAQELREQYSAKGAFVGRSLEKLAQEQLSEAAKAGLTQVTLSFPASLYSGEEMSQLGRFLREHGYKTVRGSSSGYIGTNLLVPAKHVLTVIW
jgi:hypothetical protein